MLLFSGPAYLELNGCLEGGPCPYSAPACKVNPEQAGIVRYVIASPQIESSSLISIISITKSHPRSRRLTIVHVPRTRRPSDTKAPFSIIRALSPLKLRASLGVFATQTQFGQLSSPSPLLLHRSFLRVCLRRGRRSSLSSHTHRLLRHPLPRTLVSS